MSRAGGPSGEDEPAEQDNAGRVQYVPISTLSDEEKVKAWSADCGDIRSAVRGGTIVPVERRDAFSSWITDGYDCGAKKSVGEAEQLRMVLNHSRLLQQEMTAAAKEAVKLAVDVEDLRSRGLEREARARLHAGRMAALAKLQELLAQHPKMFGHDPDRGLPSVLQRQLMSFLPLLLRQAPDSAVALYVWLTVNQGMLPSNRAEHSGCGIGSRAISTTCDEGLGGKVLALSLEVSLNENFLPSDTVYTAQQRQARQRLHHLVVFILLWAGFRVADLFGSCVGALLLTGAFARMDQMFTAAAQGDALVAALAGGPSMQAVLAKKENAPLARRHASCQLVHLVFACNPAKFCQISPKVPDMVTITVHTWYLGLARAAELAGALPEGVPRTELARRCTLAILRRLRAQAGQRPGDFAHQLERLPERAEQLLEVLAAYEPGAVNVWVKKTPRHEEGRRILQDEVQQLQHEVEGHKDRVAALERELAQQRSQGGAAAAGHAGAAAAAAAGSVGGGPGLDAGHARGGAGAPGAGGSGGMEAGQAGGGGGGDAGGGNAAAATAAGGDAAAAAAAGGDAAAAAAAGAAAEAGVGQQQQQQQQQGSLRRSRLGGDGDPPGGTAGASSGGAAPSQHTQLTELSLAGVQQQLAGVEEKDAQVARELAEAQQVFEAAEAQLEAAHHEVQRARKRKQKAEKKKEKSGLRVQRYRQEVRRRRQGSQPRPAGGSGFRAAQRPPRPPGRRQHKQGRVASQQEEEEEEEEEEQQQHQQEQQQQQQQHHQVEEGGHRAGERRVCRQLLPALAASHSRPAASEEEEEGGQHQQEQPQQQQQAFSHHQGFSEPVNFSEPQAISFSQQPAGFSELQGFSHQGGDDGFQPQEPLASSLLRQAQGEGEADSQQAGHARQIPPPAAQVPAVPPRLPPYHAPQPL
ncbi:hypothetical protein ABPG75_011850 [Micractinium tetrahymenae]